MVKYNMNESVLISNMMSIDFCPRDKLKLGFQRTKSQMYSILNYDKNYVCKDDLYIGMYRSVIFSFPNKKLLSYTPSKSISFNRFKTICPALNETIVVTEHIDGMMVQLFYDERIDKWEIATINHVGGNEVYFYDASRRTILQIFTEVLGGMPDDDLNMLPFLEYFPRNCCFTFIIDPLYSEINQMQYSCYLIGVYSVNNELPNSLKYIPESCYSNWDCIESVKGLIKLPKKFFFNNYSDMLESIIYLHTPNKYSLADTKTGIHCTVESDEYTVQQNIKSQHPFEHYLFFCLKRIYEIEEMCSMYPDYRKQLYNAKNSYERMITNIHKTYKDYYVDKKSIELPKIYKKHIEIMHKTIYIPSIKTKNPDIITRSVVKRYFDTLMPNEILYLFVR